MIAKCGKCGREQEYSCAIDLVQINGWFINWGNRKDDLCPTCYSKFKAAVKARKEK